MKNRINEFFKQIIFRVNQMKNRIKELRARYNLTQEELAQKAEVTRQTISSLEKGRYDPSLKLAFRLARIFETQIEEVFLYEE